MALRFFSPFSFETAEAACSWEKSERVQQYSHLEDMLSSPSEPFLMEISICKRKGVRISNINASLGSALGMKAAI